MRGGSRRPEEGVGPERLEVGRWRLCTAAAGSTSALFDKIATKPLDGLPYGGAVTYRELVHSREQVRVDWADKKPLIPPARWYVTRRILAPGVSSPFGPHAPVIRTRSGIL
jgi:hypothetical protein